MERSHNIALDDEGNMYITGWFQSPSLSIGGITLTNSGGGATKDAFVAKFDPSGTPLWAVSAYGPNAEDYGNDIAVDDDFVYITGSFEFDGIYFESSTMLENSGGSDFFVACFKKTSGSHVWSFTNNSSPLNADQHEYGEGISVDSDHHLHFIGSTNSDLLDCGAFSLSNTSPGSSTFDIFIGSVTVSGATYDISWMHNPLGDGNDYGMDICNDAFGNIYATGYFYSQQLSLDASTILHNTDISGATSDIFTAGYSGGTCIGAHNPNGEADDYALGIATNGFDLFITGGYKSSILDFEGSSSAISNPATMFTDFYITRYTLPGFSAQWCRTADADITPAWNFDDYGRDLAIDPAGYVYLAGWYNSYKINFGDGEITNETNNNYSEIILAKYDRDGLLYWSESGHGIYNDKGMGVDVNTTDGCCVFTGWYENDPLSLGDYSLPLANPVEISDFFLGKACGYDCMLSCDHQTDTLDTGIAGIGSIDPYWDITVDPSGGVVPRPATGCIWSTPEWRYGFPFEGTNWISVNDEPTAAVGVYTFERTFIIPDSCGTPMLSLCLLADDHADVYLNGTPLGSGGGLYEPLHIDLEGGPYFLPGANILRVDIHNTIPDKMAFDLKGIICCDEIITGIGDHDAVWEKEIQLYPNPAHESLHIQSGKDVETAMIFSSTGQMVMQMSVDKGDNVFNIAHLSPGMYLVRVTDAQNTCTQVKFIKK